MDKKENRKVILTKRVLKESFLQFLSEKPLTKITVKEICEDADLNRSTYYAYYTDPYDQLKKLENDLMSGMAAYVDSIDLNDVNMKSKQTQTIKAILEYIESQKETFQILLGEYGDAHFETNMLSFFGERIFEKMHMEGEGAVKKAYEYIYAATGSFGIIKRWILNKEQISIDTLADWITEINDPLVK